MRRDRPSLTLFRSPAASIRLTVGKLTLKSCATSAGLSRAFARLGSLIARTPGVDRSVPTGHATDMSLLKSSGIRLGCQASHGACPARNSPQQGSGHAKDGSRRGRSAAQTSRLPDEPPKQGTGGLQLGDLLWPETRVHIDHDLRAVS